MNTDFMLVSVNMSDSAKVARDYINKHSFSFPVWSDLPGNSMIKFGLQGLQASNIIDTE